MFPGGMQIKSNFKIMAGVDILRMIYAVPGTDMGSYKGQLLFNKVRMEL